MNYSFGAMPPLGSEWIIGKTAASIKAASDAEEIISSLNEMITRIKNGDLVLQDEISITDILFTLVNSK